MRCFSVSQVYQNPEQSEFGAALSFLAQISPFVRTPANAIESYATAGCFPIIGFFLQKRVASLFSCRRSFLLSPSATYSAHPADRAVPPHNTKKTAAPQRRSAANYPRRRNYFFAGSFSTALNTASDLSSSKKVSSEPLISKRSTSSSILTNASSYCMSGQGTGTRRTGFL